MEGQTPLLRAEHTRAWRTIYICICDFAAVHAGHIMKSDDILEWWVNVNAFCGNGSDELVR